MQKYEKDQLVMVRQRYGTIGDPFYAMQIVREPDCVIGGSKYNSGFRYQEYVPFDPEKHTKKGMRHYVGVSAVPRLVICYVCRGDKHVTETVPEKFDYDLGTYIPEHEEYVACETCSGTGECMTNPHIDYVINASDKIMDLETYEKNVAAPERERKIIQEQRMENQRKLEGEIIDQLIDVVTSSNGDKKKIAKFISHFGRASVSWSQQSTLYKGAERIMEDN